MKKKKKPPEKLPLQPRTLSVWLFEFDAPTVPSLVSFADHSRSEMVHCRDDVYVRPRLTPWAEVGRGLG